MKFLIRLVVFIAAAGVLFVGMVRTSVWAHTVGRFDPLVSILSGMLTGTIAAFVLCLLVMHWVLRRRLSWSTFRYAGILSMGAAILLSGYFVLNISGSHLKHDGMMKEYRELHPVLRQSIGLLVLAENELIITDASRLPAEYSSWGLVTNEKSLHYVQPDGFVYAFDLRTRGHSEFRNHLLKTYFDLMGFQTLRHGGTADHLHISLPCHLVPGAQ